MTGNLIISVPRINSAHLQLLIYNVAFSIANDLVRYSFIGDDSAGMESVRELGKSGFSILHAMKSFSFLVGNHRKTLSTNPNYALRILCSRQGTQKDTIA